MKALAEPGAAGSRSGRIGRGLVLAVALCAVLVGVGAALAVRHMLRRSSPRASSTIVSRLGSPPAPSAIVTRRNGLYGDATWPAGSVAAPAITTLHDQSGRTFSLASLRGHPVAMAFFDSHCHQECPLEGRQLAAAERKLPPAQRPDLVVVSVNPNDTPTSAARAIAEWGLAGVSPWHWLMGTHRQLAPVWAEYHIQVLPPANGDISHTEALYLIDRRGYERAGYLWPFASRFATYDMRVLARGKAA